MKNINYLSLILSSIFLLDQLYNYFFINDNYKPKDSAIISEYYEDFNTTYIKFKNNNIKIKNDEVIVLNLTSTLNNINFISSDEEKIKIINKTNNCCYIKKIAHFSDIIKINVFFNNIILDTCHVSCFNNITNINKINIYKYENDYNLNNNQITNYSDGYYLMDFHLTKYFDFLPFEDETISLIEDFIKNNFGNDFEKFGNLLYGNLTYKFYLNTKMFFSNSICKTITLKIDDLQYNLYLELGI